MHAGNNTPITYLITAGEVNDANFREASLRVLDIIRVAVEENVSMIQLREKALCGRLLCELVSGASEIRRGSATKLLVNDRADIALACGADGVHLTATSLPAKSIRRVFPSGFIIGVSTHTVEEVVSAAQDGADLAVFGPVFSTPGKGEPTGLELLAAACAAGGKLPVIGLGGVDETNFLAVIDAGASGCAAIRAMNDMERLRSIMRAARDI